MARPREHRCRRLLPDAGRAVLDWALPWFLILGTLALPSGQNLLGLRLPIGGEPPRKVAALVPVVLRGTNFGPAPESGPSPCGPGASPRQPLAAFAAPTVLAVCPAARELSLVAVRHGGERRHPACLPRDRAIRSGPLGFRALEARVLRKAPSTLHASFVMTLMTPEERVGTILGGKYKLASVMAEGGMGVVFAAEHVVTQRPLVVKLLRPDRDPQPEDVARMFREARALAAFEHPNSVEVLDVETCQEGTPYLVMPRLQGESLEERLWRESRLDPTTALRLLLPVIGVVAYAHDAGVVHRDIKPGNIMLASDPAGRITPKLIDFGIAQVLDGDARIADTGIALGTTHYMSPEQAMGQQITAAADVWALGVVLFECLGGELPFDGEVLTDVMVCIVNQPARNLDEVAPELPKRLTTVIHNCLAKDPKRRYRDARALAYALAVAAVRSGIQLPFQPDPIGLPDWRRWLTTATRPADLATPRRRDGRRSSDTETTDHGQENPVEPAVPRPATAEAGSSDQAEADPVGSVVHAAPRPATVEAGPSAQAEANPVGPPVPAVPRPATAEARTPEWYALAALEPPAPAGARGPVATASRPVSVAGTPAPAGAGGPVATASRPVSVAGTPVPAGAGGPAATASRPVGVAGTPSSAQDGPRAPIQPWKRHRRGRRARTRRRRILAAIAVALGVLVIWAWRSASDPRRRFSR